jgi:WD40 repeat protein
MEEESKDSYEYKPPRAYVQRIKRHQDAIIALHSPHGIEGTELVSGSADE